MLTQQTIPFTISHLHERALVCAKQFRKAEAELLQTIQKIDAQKVFRHYGFASLYSYTVQALGLSESQAYNFINVARKAREIPELEKAVCSGKLSVSKARKIVPVVNRKNSAEWIQKALILPQKEIERQVADLQPESLVRERVRPIAKDRFELRCALSTALERKLRRAQDIISQNKKRAASIETTLEAVLEEFLNRKDPLEKAKRARAHVAKKPVGTLKRDRHCPKRTPLPASVLHSVRLRDQGKCTYLDNQGKRCASARWVEIHHKIPLSRGGPHTLENLVSLCSGHHKTMHMEKSRAGRTVSF